MIQWAANLFRMQNSGMGSSRKSLTSLTWESVQAELNQAEEARSAGNEGMARVCARRAAGFAAGAYLDERKYGKTGSSAYDQLRHLCEIPDISPRVRQAAEYLLIHVTPEHALPVQADLIAEARWLAEFLIFGEQGADRLGDI